MTTFKEEDHPRDGDGKFTDKNGVSVSGATDIDRLVAIAERVKRQRRELSDSINARANENRQKEADSKYQADKLRIESAVFDKISTERRALESKGYAIIKVYTFDYVYRVKLYGSDKDFEYKILWREKNDN